jgi:hypothetical protein
MVIVFYNLKLYLIFSLKLLTSKYIKLYGHLWPHFYDYAAKTLIKCQILFVLKYNII